MCVWFDFKQSRENIDELKKKVWIIPVIEIEVVVYTIFNNMSV